MVGHTATSTHVAPGGGVRMVDVHLKAPTLRRAVAVTRVRMNVEAFGRLSRADAPKGDVLGTARIAGILAAKRTSELIPLCHPVALTRVAIELVLEPDANSVEIRAVTEALDRTGVEMEAMVAASMAALTVYDMLKAFDRAMEIGPTTLLEKSGGRSGDYTR
ncbi:MAG: cyclic pyranopterin monophosphate synthase MoaC [Sorangiineae bacterium]|nr:cyclic pyranopterin monophosphate synthase MoaC [Polyangiaceae bacterium]MEB2323867.1 cyclic pyranopterin monophosphate synthase MoaC [Sorangiineae bacterium]